MKKKYYDFKLDMLSIIFTAVFSVLTTLLMFVSESSREGLVSSASKQGFLFTPAGLLIVCSCFAMIFMAILSIRKQEFLSYMLVPVSIMGILYGLRPVLVQGEFSEFLNLPGAPLCIALVRALLGIFVVLFLFLLVTNVFSSKRYLIITLVVSIVWCFGSEAFLFYNGWVGRFYSYGGNQTTVLLSQITYYFSVIFYTFNIQCVNRQNSILTNAKN